MPDWNDVTDYFAGKRTHAAIKAGLYINTLTTEQQTELQENAKELLSCK